MGKDDGQLIGAFDLEEEMRKADEEAKAAVRAKDELIEKAQADGKITPQFADFLKGVDTSTFGSSTANLHKVELILSMKDVLSDKNISGRKTVSLYSGFDWRLPVALGARDITMVDTGFSDDGLTSLVADGVRECDLEMIHEGNEISFSIDFGSGKERVRLLLDSSSVASFVPKEEVGFILESHGASGDLHRSPLPTPPSLLGSLSNGALIFNDRYGHDTFFTPELGLKDIGVGDHHFYEVVDKDKMISSTGEIVRPSSPSLDQLRQIAQSHNDSQS
jgi:hypothetical protein